MTHFHGYHKKRSFFEGWYLKHQSPDGVLALIPAYHIDSEGRSSASLQVITPSKAWMLTCSGDSFHAASRSFYVNYDTTTFSPQGINLDISAKELTLKGHLAYTPFTPPRSDIMGPFRFAPFLECSHGIVSLSHRIRGHVILNRRKIDFNGGIGYIEKDWGRSFPSRYVWSQCSWIDRKSGSPCCLMASAADVPIFKTNLTGFIGSILFRGKEYRLATYLGSKLVRFTPQEIMVNQGQLTLHVELIKSRPLSLHAPDLGSMSRSIKESAACQTRCRLFYENRKIFDITCHYAGFEAYGF